jgi:hypothetical protein
MANLATRIVLALIVIALLTQLPGLAAAEISGPAKVIDGVHGSWFGTHRALAEHVNVEPNQSYILGQLLGGQCAAVGIPGVLGTVPGHLIVYVLTYPCLPTSVLEGVSK